MIHVFVSRFGKGMRSEILEMNCKLIEEILKIDLHLNKRNSHQNVMISSTFTLNGSPNLRRTEHIVIGIWNARFKPKLPDHGNDLSSMKCTVINNMYDIVVSG